MGHVLRRPAHCEQVTVLSEGGAGRTAIHIALAFDDNFWAPAYAVMRSVCLFTHRKGDLVFHLFQRGLSDEHKDDLRKISVEFGADQVWYDLDEAPVFNELVRFLPHSRRLTKVIYARLMIDRLLDPGIERIIYLDCDMLVRDAIEQLYDVDMVGKPIAAVRDTYGAFIVGGRDLMMNRDLFDIADPYFNSGMLLIDLPRWRAADVLGRLDLAIRDGTMARLYYDQDFLNLVFKNDWAMLPPRWNTIDARFAHEGLDPAIVHYTGPQKPWQLIAFVAFRRLYRHVMTNELFYRFMRHRWRTRFRRTLGLK